MDILELVHGSDATITRPFRCTDPGCYKAFSRKSDLARHQRIHANDRPYACTYDGCGKAFIQRSALTVHVRVHTGERPHACTVAGCGKAFGDSSSLARHRRVHTGARPYTCPAHECSKTFCRKITLTKHIKRHHPSALLTPLSEGYRQGSPPECSPTPSRGLECSPSPEVYPGENPIFGLGIHLPMSNGSSLVLPSADHYRCASSISDYSAFSAPVMQPLTSSHPYSSPSSFQEDPTFLPPSPPLTVYSSEDLSFEQAPQHYSYHELEASQNRHFLSSSPSVRDLPAVPPPFFWPETASHGQTLPQPTSPLHASRFSGMPASPRAPFAERFEDGPTSSPTYSRFANSTLPLMIQSPTFASYFSLSSPTFNRGCRGNSFSYEVQRRYSQEYNSQLGIEHRGDF